LFSPVHTEAITLCLSLVRARGAAGACTAAAAGPTDESVAAKGAAAMLVKNSRRFMRALYHVPLGAFY
jgi:hypothetical protein